MYCIDVITTNYVGKCSYIYMYIYICDIWYIWYVIFDIYKYIHTYIYIYTYIFIVRLHECITVHPHFWGTILGQKKRPLIFPVIWRIFLSLNWSQRASILGFLVFCLQGLVPLDQGPGIPNLGPNSRIPSPGASSQIRWYWLKELNLPSLVGQLGRWFSASRGSAYNKKQQVVRSCWKKNESM